MHGGPIAAPPGHAGTIPAILNPLAFANHFDFDVADQKARQHQTQIFQQLILLMKVVIFLLFSIGASLPLFAQKPTCQSLHEGAFKITTEETGTTLIKRTKTYQVEENARFGYKIIFDIKWLDECTYELKPRQLITGDPAIMGNGKNVLTTRIKKINKTTYVAETSANFSDQIMSFEVEIL